MFEMFCGFSPFADDDDIDEQSIYMRVIEEDLEVGQVSF